MNTYKTCTNVQADTEKEAMEKQAMEKEAMEKEVMEKKAMEKEDCATNMHSNNYVYRWHY